MKRFFLILTILLTLLMQGFVNAQETPDELTTLQKVRQMILGLVPDAEGLEQTNSKVDSLNHIVDSLMVIINGFEGGTSSGNPDSLNNLPAESYMLKNDSTIFASRFYTDQQLLTKAASNHNHSGVYEPIISKETGYLRWNGTSWGFINETYSLSSHNHSGVYEPVLISGTSIKTINGNSLLGSGNLSVSGTVNLAYPDEKTIALNDSNAIKLDGITLKLNGSNEIEVVALPSLPDSITFASELTSGLAGKQDALGFTPVTNARTLTINGTSYDLSANRSWTVAAGADSGVINDLIGTYIDTLASDTLTHSVAQIDSAITSLEGGTTGQVLTKNSATNFDASWQTPSASGDTTHYVDFNKVKALQDSIDALQSSIASIVNNGDPRVPFMWAYLQLDTTGTDPNFPDSTNAATNTLIASQIRGVSQDATYGVGKVLNVSSSEYRVKYDLRGTPTWTSWSNSQTDSYFKGIDSIQVRDTSSASNSTSTNVIVNVAGVVDTFLITTISSGGDTLGTDLAPNGGSELAYTGANEWFSAFGGTITRSTGEQVRTGTYSAKGETVGGGTGIQFSLNATATPTETYWVEGYIYISTAGGEIRAETGGSSTIISTVGSWTYFKYSFVAADDSPYINFVEDAGSTSPVTFYVDDVTVKERLP